MNKKAVKQPKPRNKPFTLPDGRHYEKMKDLAREMGIARAALILRRRKGQPPFGNAPFKRHTGIMASARKELEGAKEFWAIEEGRERVRRIINIRREWLILLLERLSRPGNEACAAIALAALKCQEAANG